MSDVEQLVLGAWGDIKTAKTTLGLSYPTPWVLFDFDLGFARSKHRLPLIQPGKTLIEVPWNMPLNRDILGAADMIVKSYKLPIKFPKQPVRGWLSLWEDEVLPDITMTMEAENINSLLYDTGTVMWNLGKDAQLERAQNNASNKTAGGTRESLSEIEYSMPNQEMRAVLGSAKHYGKNLYIPHHVGGKYQPTMSGKSERVGDTWDGWRHLGAIVDVIVHTEFEIGPLLVGMPSTRTPAARIETCGYTLGVEGKVILEPTFNLILALINQQREVDAASPGLIVMPGIVLPAGIL